MNEVAELQDAIRAASDPMAVMRRVVDQALVLIPAADGAVVELAHEGYLTYVCASGTLADHVGTRLRVEESLSGLSVRTGETLHCEDCASDPRVDREACRAVGAVSMVCVPLRREKEPVGALKVTAGRPYAFAHGDVATLARLADFISALIAAISDISHAAEELAGDAPPDDELLAESRDADLDAGHGPSHADGISAFVANVLRPGITTDVAARQRIERALVDLGFTILCQPIVDLGSGEMVGAEALARFREPPQRPPDVWFDEAKQVGRGVQLQLAAIEQAVGLIDHLPQPAFLSINVGPDAIAAPELRILLQAASFDRIVIELTEHLRIDDYPHLRSVLETIRGAGARLAIDDTGAGFSSLAHIVNLAPDLIKLDRQFTTGIDLDPVRRAIAQALVSFARETGAQVIAEGIETAEELETVRRLGIPLGQGYFIGRPAPLASMPRDFSHVARR